MVERRRHRRKKISVEVEYIAKGSFFTGYTKDLSAGGIFIITNETVKPGEKIFVDFYLPGVKNKIKLKGRVVRVIEFSDNDDFPGMGIEFTEIRDEIRKILDTYVVIEFLPEGI